jgi:glycosyltransferase involved in cell wall biosynthesis
MNVTLVIPSRNNLKYVKFAYESIRNHIGKDVELVLMDDASTDKTWEFMRLLPTFDKNVKIYRNDGPDRIGHTVLYDIGAKMATNEVFGIFHADMIATPNYLKNMIKHVKRGTVVSGTRIEPPLHPPGPEKIVENFGLEPEEFQMKQFLDFVSHQENINEDKTTSGIFAPWIMYVEDFFSIGGHDKRVFAPMELEDSDLFNRFKLAGYQFIQSRDAFVYHMTCRGSRFKDGVQIYQEIPVGGGKVWKRSIDSEEYTTLRQIKFREWWRKWHMNVLHDEMMMPRVCERYDVGFVIHNIQHNQYQLLPLLEPWCDTIYTDTPVWAKEQYTNQQESISRFKIGPKLRSLQPTGGFKNDILVEFRAEEFRQEHYQFIENLMFIIEDSVKEPGEFEFDIFKFTVNKIQSYSKNLINADDPWYLDKLKTV